MENQYKILKNQAKSLNVLYVEDDIDVREQTLLILDGLFNKIEVASDGEEGLKKYKDFFKKNKEDESYDLVITDLKMPNKDGIQLSKDIFKLNKAQTIIVISAHEDSRYLIELINMGVKYFLQKPLIIDKVIESLIEITTDINEKKDLLHRINLIDGFCWYKQKKILKRYNKEVKLATSETVLIDLLINNPFITFSNEEIYNSIYSDNFDKEVSIDSIKSMIKRVRKKIPQDLIKNVYGEGYRVNSELFSK